MKRATLLLALTAVVALAESLVHAQDFPKPTSQHQLLTAMVGTWEATMKMEGAEFPG